ncbi:MAG TPA: SDR family NAD(P)-dependent oxidoreductase [Steroidobacteraceae bacterium]|nr:SDR family NAD(P)-dependent oxidoreductase [Steroidobacteraceae bacterium]
MISKINFDGRVAIVTGGGNGLGRDYCLELAKRGAKVVVNDFGGSGAGQGQSRSVADRVVDEIKSAGGQAVASYDSVATREGGQAIVDAATKAFGRVDIVINNAGFLRNNRFEDLTDAELDAILDVHLKGAFYVSQPAYRVMKEQKYGRFIFTSSASAMFGHPWQTNYGAAKGGLMALSNVVALEGLRYGIHSNALMPTAHSRLAAEMHEGWMEVTNVSKTLADIDFPAVGHLLVPEANTPLVVYLVSENCKATHGIYSCNCARYARVFIGATEGYVAEGAHIPSAEEIEANWASVEDRSRYHTPSSVYEEFVPVVEAVKRALVPPRI